MDSTNFESRLRTIEQRLSNIESALLPSTGPTSPKSTSSAADFEFADEIAPSSGGARPKTASLIEEKPGNWLGVIAVICFVLAAGFIIKLSIDSGWLTPERQIGLAAFLGMGLIGVGLRLSKIDQAYASFLPGAGVIVLYLTAFSAYRYYGLIPFDVALMLTSFVSALCVWLYTRVKHDLYAITATLGSYMAPVILGLHTEAAFSLYYFLICSFAFAVLSVFVRSRALILISSYMALAATGIAGFPLEQYEFVAVILALHFSVFALGTYFYSLQVSVALEPGEAWCFLPVLLMFYAMEYYCIDHIHHGLAPWISLGFAALLVGLYLSAKRVLPQSGGSQSLVVTFASIVCFHSIYLELLPHHIRPWLFVVIVLLGAFIPMRDFKEPLSIWAVPAVTLLIVALLEYLAMLWHLLTIGITSWIIAPLAGLAALWVLLIKSNQPGEREESFVGGLLLAAAHLLAIMSFYRLTTDYGSLAVSATWLCYAVSVIVLSFVRKDQVMAKSALLVLGLAAGKALLYDAASAPTLIRIFCLLLTGAVLYGCGFFMRKTASWKKI